MGVGVSEVFSRVWFAGVKSTPAPLEGVLKSLLFSRTGQGDTFPNGNCLYCYKLPLQGKRGPCWRALPTPAGSPRPLALNNPYARDM